MKNKKYYEEGKNMWWWYEILWNEKVRNSSIGCERIRYYQEVRNLLMKNYEACIMKRCEKIWNDMKIYENWLWFIWKVKKK